MKIVARQGYRRSRRFPRTRPIAVGRARGAVARRVGGRLPSYRLDLEDDDGQVVHTWTLVPGETCVPSCSGLATCFPEFSLPPAGSPLDAVAASPSARRYTVGRKECTVIISDDPSISRVTFWIAISFVEGSPRVSATSPSLAPRWTGRRVDATAADGVPLLAEARSASARAASPSDARNQNRSATLTRETSGPEREDDRTTDGEGGALYFLGALCFNVACAAGGPSVRRARASARRRTPTIPRTSTSTERCRANTRRTLPRTSLRARGDARRAASGAGREEDWRGAEAGTAAAAAGGTDARGGRERAGGPRDSMVFRTSSEWCARGRERARETPRRPR